MTPDIVPFDETHIDDAAFLLAHRHEQDRTQIPELPTRFSDSNMTRRALKSALARKHAEGFAALNDGQLIAYLIGDLVLDNQWGRSGWVRSAGCAYDPDAGVEVIRDLYAALGANWVSLGVFIHFALIPVTDPTLLHAWFSLSFGIEQIHALLDLTTLPPELPFPLPGYEIRRAEPQDRQQMAEMSDVIWSVQVKAPVWGVMMPETIRETAEGWSKLVDDESVTVWLALKDERVVGVQVYQTAEMTDDNLIIPKRCVRLLVAGTREEERGKSIGTSLTRYGLAQAQADGYRYCETDWRSTNLLASRFWPHRNFRPVIYRLVRRIDQRIAWAQGGIGDQMI